MGVKGQSLLSYMNELRVDIKGYVVSIKDYEMDGLINDGFCNIVYDILMRKEGKDEKEALKLAIQNYRPSYKLVVHKTRDKIVSTAMNYNMGLSITDEEFNKRVINYLKEYHKVDDIETDELLRFVINYKNKENECPYYFAGDIIQLTGLYDTYMVNLMDYSHV
jgi:hypothetical protein